MKDSSFFLRQKYQDLKSWRHSEDRKPLIVRGARQVGKTSLIRQFARQEYSHLIEINFEEEPSFKAFFQGDFDVARILSSIEIRRNQKIDPKKTLIFFDEIQECPEAVKSLRYFYEKAPEYHIVAAGSLLDFALEKMTFPVGRVDLLYLYPLNFDEFLLATGRDILSGHIPSVDNLNPDQNPESLKALALALDEYLIIGGMPAVVGAYNRQRSMLDVAKEQNLIIKTLADDTRKYARGDKQLENIANVFLRIPKFIGQTVTYTTLGEEDSHQRTKKSLELLNLAKICTFVFSASPASTPLGSFVNSKHFKCLFLDVGLCCRIFTADSPIQDLSGLSKELIGKLCEQFVGQELRASSTDFSDHLYCWVRPKKTARAEVDYLISRQSKVVPIEVKNDALGKIRSLKVLMTEYPKIEKAYVLSRGASFESRNGIERIPIFCKI